MKGLSEMIRIVFSDDPKMQQFNPPAPVKCEFCGADRHFQGLLNGPRVSWVPEPILCTCEQAIEKEEQKRKERAEAEAKEEQERREFFQRQRINKIFEKSGLGRRFRTRTFEAFNVTPENQIGYKAAKGYAGNFRRAAETGAGQEKNGLFIHGPKGTGKTHLAAAIANQLMNEGVPVVFATMIDMLAKIKASFDKLGTAASEGDVMKLYKTADLLIIDDIGKEQPTEWALSKIYQIINARYEDYKPVIITSNYSAADLVNRMTPSSGDKQTADATVDRLLEMAYTVPLAGESWRTKK